MSLHANLTIKEQIEKWQYQTMKKQELNTLICNLLCELAQYDKGVNLLVTKIPIKNNIRRNKL